MPGLEAYHVRAAEEGLLQHPQAVQAQAALSIPGTAETQDSGRHLEGLNCFFQVLLVSLDPTLLPRTLPPRAGAGQM